ncbi:MAG: hypothetical protein ACK53K_00215 [Burkholderiales bacterium]
MELKISSLSQNGANQATQNQPPMNYKKFLGIKTAQGLSLQVMLYESNGIRFIKTSTGSYRLPANIANSEPSIKGWVLDQQKKRQISGLYQLDPSAWVKNTLKNSTPDGIQAKDVVNAISQAAADGNIYKPELKNISKLVSLLNPSEHQNLVTVLSQTQSKNKTGQNLLQEWLGEVTSSGLGDYDGLSGKEQNELLNRLVAHQNSANLERLQNALTDPQQREQPHVEALGRSIAQHARPAEKMAFIQKMSQRGLLQNPSVARAVAHVFAKINSAQDVDWVTDQIGRSGMDAMVAASFDRKAWDPSLLIRLANTMKLSGNPRVKSSFVAASGPVLESIVNDGNWFNQKKSPVMRQVTLSVFQLISTDTNGIIQNTLAQTGEVQTNTTGSIEKILKNPTKGLSNGRHSLKNFFLGLIDTQQFTLIAGISLALQRANQYDKNPSEWLSQKTSFSGEEPHYQHARVMGDISGIVRSAITSRISRRDLFSARTSLTASAATDTLKELIAAANPAAKLPVALLGTWLKNGINYKLLEWRTELAKGDNNVGQRSLEIAIPNHPNGVEETGPWVDTLKASYAWSKDLQ